MLDPHLKKIPRAELGEDLAPLWDAAMRDRDEATLIEVAGNAPEVMDWYYNSFYARMFHGGRVEVRIKQLARMKLSTMHGCAFCNRGNSKAALADGVSQEQLDALFDPASALFDDRERAVLAGDNTNRPTALYLAATVQLKTGARIVTSGQGGVFPPGLPVGIVASTGAGGVRVETFVRTDRLDYVRILDFGLVNILDGGQAGAAALSR